MNLECYFRGGVGWVSMVTLIFGLGVTIINIYRVVIHPYDRPANAASVSTAIAATDRAWEQYQKGEADQWDFLQRATQAYAEGIEYMWPKHDA